MAAMRAKMQIQKIDQSKGDDGKIYSEILHFNCVAKSTSYGDTGLDDDNTFAKYSPSGSLTLTVANEALHGKFAVGEKFYLDFTKAE